MWRVVFCFLCRTNGNALSFRRCPVCACLSKTSSRGSKSRLARTSFVTSASFKGAISCQSRFISAQIFIQEQVFCTKGAKTLMQNPVSQAPPPFLQHHLSKPSSQGRVGRRCGLLLNWPSASVAACFFFLFKLI